MAFKKKFSGETDKTIQLGDKANPKRISIEGYYLGTKDIPDSGYGPGKLHIFQTQEGSVGVWGKTNSNRLMTSDLVGQMVRLTFTGMGAKVKGKNPAYQYELEHDEDNTTDTSGINVNAAPEGESTNEDDDSEDSIEDEAPADEIQPARVATTPRAVAKAPTADRIAAVKQQLLNRNKSA